MFNHLIKVLREETSALHLRLLLVQALLSLLPSFTGIRVRPLFYRALGFKIGSGTLMAGCPNLSGSGPIRQRLSVGQRCWFNVGVFINLGAQVTIEDDVGLGHEVMILTNSHQIGPHEHRVGPLTALPVRIGAGAWVGARVTVLPGVTIGPGSIIAAGAVVVADIPADVLAAGVPARVIRSLVETPSAPRSVPFSALPPSLAGKGGGAGLLSAADCVQRADSESPALLSAADRGKRTAESDSQ